MHPFSVTCLLGSSTSFTLKPVKRTTRYTLRRSLRHFIIKDKNTGWFRENMPYFGRTLFMLNYIDKNKNNHIESWTVTEILEPEKFGHLAVPRIVHVQRDSLSVHCASPSFIRSQAMRRVSYVKYLKTHDSLYETSASFATSCFCHSYAIYS